MSVQSIKTSFEEVPTKATEALQSQVAYYKLFLFRFIAKLSEIYFKADPDDETEDISLL